MSSSSREAASITLEPKSFVRGTVLFICLAAMAWMSYELRAILALILLAIVIAMAIDPLITRLTGLGLSRSQSVIAVLLISLILLCAIAITFAPLLIDQTTDLVDLLPREYEQIRLRLLSSSSQPITLLASQLPAYDDLGQFLNLQPQLTKDTLSTLLARTGDVFLTAIAIIITILMVTFWMLEWPTLVTLIKLLLPMSNQERFDDAVRFVQTSVGGFVRGQAILCLVIGVLSFIAYLLIGLPNPFILAILAGLFEAVPILGPTLGAIPAGLVAVGVDPGMLIGVAVSTAIIQGLENGLLVPRVLGKSVGVHPVLVLLSLTAFTAFLGLPGALLAIPLASLFQNLIRLQIRAAPEDSDESNLEDSHSDLIDEVVQLQVEVEELTRRSFGTDLRPVGIGQQMAGILRDIHRLLSQREETRP